MKNKKKILLWIFVGVFAVIFVGIGVVILVKVSSKEEQSSDQGQGNASIENAQDGSNLIQNEATQKGMLLSHNNCEGTGTVELTNYPMDPEDFKFIIPYGLVIGAHVTPIDHQYFEPADRDLSGSPYEVYAMADGKIVEISARESGVGGEEYRIVFMHTCTFFTYYDLVTKLTPEVEAEYTSNKSGNSAILDIEVMGGQQIGWIGGQTLDFAVWNTETKLDGFSVPSHYDSEPWKIHTADPYDYYSFDIIQTMIDKNLRTDEPIAGKIDYDQGGRLIGNWFRDGTEGYGSGENYWEGHFSIAPEHLDQSAIIASFGDFEGEPKQYALNNPTPHPTEVSVDSGLVKYDLYDWDYYKSNGERWDRNSLARGLELRPTSQRHGCVAIEMVGESKIRMEIFPNSSCSSVSELTDAAVIYRR